MAWVESLEFERFRDPVNPVATLAEKTPTQAPFAVKRPQCLSDMRFQHASNLSISCLHVKLLFIIFRYKNETIHKLLIIIRLNNRRIYKYRAQKDLFAVCLLFVHI